MKLWSKATCSFSSDVASGGLRRRPKENHMNWFKAGAWGFVVGSIVTMIVGFSWGGWTTGGTASRTAIERANAAVTAALVPVCIEKSKADPATAQKLGALLAPTSSSVRVRGRLAGGMAT